MNRAEYAETVAHLAGFQFMRWWHRDALADRRVSSLPASLRGAYPWILSVAAGTPLPGALVDFDGSAMTPRTIAAESGVAVSTVTAFLRAGEERGILGLLDEGIVYFPKFAARQISVEEAKRLEDRKQRARVAAYRKWELERAKADAAADANAAPNGSAAAPPNADANEEKRRTEQRREELLSTFLPDINPPPARRRTEGPARHRKTRDEP